MDEALGDSFSGVLVSDFYAACHHYDDTKQRCWAHLLRNVHDQRTLYSKDAALVRWVAAVHQLYVEAKAFSHPQPRRRRTAQLALERQLLAICRPFLAAPYWIRGTLRLRGRTGRARGQQPGRAERVPPGHQPQGQRRHRLRAGHLSKMTRTSRFGTWRAQGLSPLAACPQLLTSPRF